MCLKTTLNVFKNNLLPNSKNGFYINNTQAVVG